MKKANNPESRRAPARGPRREPGGIGARRVAVAALDTIDRAQGAVDDAVGRALDAGTLDPRDRAFARNLIATTLRRRGQIDAALLACLDRPLSGQVTAIRNILRLGAAQLLFLETPSHAAVDSAVRLAEAGPNRRYKGLINAVLRRLTREAELLTKDQDAARLNTARWLWDSWTTAYGAETCRRIADAHLAEPPLDLSVRTAPESWAERLSGSVLPGGSVRLWPRGPVTDLDGYADGGWWVQDAAAALPVRLLGGVAGKRVVDLCAAPGGKTAQLAAMGAQVTAIDRAAARLDRLRRNLSRLRLEAETVCADAATWQPAEAADAVLLDAPCSATGTIRRHPDIGWTKTPEQVRALTAEQDRLLAAALAMVKPGGTVVYCVCSLQPEEGSERIAVLHADGPEATVERIEAAELGGPAEWIDEAGFLRTLPCHLERDGGMDGFFAARLKKPE